MAEVPLYSQNGKKIGKVELPDDTFGVEPNVPVMHQVVVAQLAAARSGTHSTKSRSEVRGGGRKPWRQKGTGRARAGSIRSPIWRGGGRSHGPKPRKYAQKTPKKMKQLALRSALSDRVDTGGLVVVEEWDFSTPRTRDAAAAAEKLKISGKSILLVYGESEDRVEKSFRNIPKVHPLEVGQLNTYDIMRNEVLLVGLETLKSFAGGEVRISKKTTSKSDASKASASGGEK